MLRTPSKQQRAPPPGSGRQEQEQQAPSAADWREVVERARRMGGHVSGEQMLTDTFSRKHTYLRLSLTERCNLRCTYCMPADGAPLTPGERLLSADELQRLASLFVGAGVDKIRLTGGEPTVRKDLLEICRSLSALPGLRTLAMTSNGVALKRQLPQLQEAGLNALNISLDTLRPDRFEALTRRAGHGKVLASIEEALRLGFAPLKVNVVVMRGVNDDEIIDFSELTRDAPLNVRFIEYMPFDGNVWSDSKMVTYKEMLAALRDRYPQGLVRCADPAGEVAKNFTVPGHKGSVSFITSMTHAFCGDCNRLRVLADGSLKVCLFGANEVSLRDAMREGATDDDLRLVISAAVDRKRAAHAGMFELAATQNRPMITIGG
ncbi:Molybdopterin biosynthesis protein CNX2 [Monoraphidium neglectum]|uniref:GTP 3',8-cyclase n=1 Tax=Monoraphidium neglectum TaxID=145388 RepID=A0A0D2N4M1_9CHLO|nr:Molybdopterin biosynthesis protein CNX2 [Monoraphidium neglectum]KIZ00996.1 Molybdopterin biosynthesis protein CNX2 [Monoraphidium neglectum]|eukprot:XP_013900015.1 Molybdopterin biosynthesis protein CNX2 [Monoraphidium neglectum]